MNLVFYIIFLNIISSSFYREIKTKKNNIRYLLKYKQLHCKFGIFFFISKFGEAKKKKVHRKQINQSTFNLTTLISETIKQFRQEFSFKLETFIFI